MVEILGVLVSLDIFQEMFCCDLSKCHGICCVEGDAGAPVLIDEVAELEEACDVVWNDLPAKAREQIKAEGVVYPDKDGELVTQIINNKDCVFVKYDNVSLDGGKTRGPRCALCAIDRAFREAESVTQQPVVIIQHSTKGKGVSFMENEAGWHGKAPNEEQAKQAVEELGGTW